MSKHPSMPSYFDEETSSDQIYVLDILDYATFIQLTKQRIEDIYFLHFSPSRPLSFFDKKKECINQCKTNLKVWAKV